MKKILIGLLAVITLLTSFASCKAKLEPNTEGYYCKKNGVTYKLIDFQYAPVALGDEFAILMDGADESALFEIQNVSADKWLATANGDLFCAVGETVPTFEQMQSDKILICTEGTNAIVALVEISDSEAVSSIVDQYADGMELKYPYAEEQSELLILRFASSKYSWLYYSLTYIEFVDDVYVCDYPEDISNYTYRDVDDSVKVTTTDQFECWYKVTDTTAMDMYENIAKDADVDFYTVSLPTENNGLESFAIYIFDEKNSVDECIDELVASYEGTLSEEELREKVSAIYKTEEVTEVKYNYGKYFIFDQFSGKCVKVDDTLHKYRNYEIRD